MGQTDRRTDMRTLDRHFTKDSNGQITAGVERCCACYHRHSEVRSRSWSLHDQLHWLDVPDRVLFKLAATVHQCLNGRAPAYLSWSTASRSPVLTRGGICVPPTVTYLPYRVSGSTLTAVGRSQLLVRWPGTHSRILSRMQRAAQTVLGVYLKHICSRVTNASTSGILNDYALYKSTHSFT